MRIAVVHDWLTVIGGGERLLSAILSLYPEADLFSVLDCLPESDRSWLLGKRAHTTFVQHLPFVKRFYRLYLPLMPYAIERLDLSSYDLVLSSSHAVAKGVISSPDQLHICYCHSPMRYAWDLQSAYGTPWGLGWLSHYFLHKLRLWDVRTAHGVDAFIANSAFVARRILKCYRRPSRVIYGPLDTDFFSLHLEKEDFYVTASRFVPYKRVDLLIEAFRRMPKRRLVVLGTGPSFEALREGAPANVELLGHVSEEVLRFYLQRGRAFLYAGIEDFGLVMAEAQACGTPVIAFGKGGAREIVRPLGGLEPTGLFFEEQRPEALVEAIERFEAHEERIDPRVCHAHAQRFGKGRFLKEFAAFVEEQLERRPRLHTLSELEAPLADLIKQQHTLL